MASAWARVVKILNFDPQSANVPYFHHFAPVLDMAGLPSLVALRAVDLLEGRTARRQP
jgi:hypothetical protein